MANVKISDLALATLPLDTANTFFELQTVEAGIDVSRKLSAQDLGIGGGVTSVNSGQNISVDNTDPQNPIVNFAPLPTAAFNLLRADATATGWEETAILQAAATQVIVEGVNLRVRSGGVFALNTDDNVATALSIDGPATTGGETTLAFTGNATFLTGGATRYQISEVNSRHVFLDFPLFLEERAAAGASVAGFGQLWVRDDTPNVLVFTDDAGTDTVLGSGGGGTPGGADTNVQYNAAGAFAGDANFTWDSGNTQLDIGGSVPWIRIGNTNDFAEGQFYMESPTAGAAFFAQGGFSGGNLQIAQTDGAQGNEGNWIECVRDAEVAINHDALSAMVSADHGIALFGEGAGGVTNTRIEFLDSLPSGTRNFVIGALGLNQSNILDELVNRPLRIAGTSGSGIENFMIGTPNGDTLLQGNTGVRVQTASGVIDFRTPSLRFSMNSAGQLNLLGNGTQSGVLNITEGTSAFGSVAGEGQLWVRDDTPCVLVFTDDAGTDFDLNTGGGFDPSSNQTITGDWTFQGQTNFENPTDDLQLDVNVSINMRNQADTGSTFIQNLGPTFQFGIAGADFGSGVFQIAQTSFAKVECPPIFIREQAAAETSVAQDGQLWVRNDTPNNLFFTDDSGNDFLVAGTGAGGDISAGANVLADTTFVAVANVSPEINREYFVLAAVEISAPAADDGQVQFVIDTNARFYGTLTNSEDDVTAIIEGQLAEVTTNNVVVPTSGAATPGGTYCTIVGRLIMGATTGTMSLRCAKNADTGADGSAIRGAIKLIPIDP